MSSSEPSSSGSSSSSSSAAVAAPGASSRLPSESTMKNVCRLAIAEDKPIMMDYWHDSLDKKALIGARENGEKLLVKTADEYTSVIQKFYRSGTEFIVITENSIYVVSSDISTRRISGASSSSHSSKVHDA